MKIDEAIADVRANPVRYAAGVLVFVVLCAAGYTLGGGLGEQLYLFMY